MSIQINPENITTLAILIRKEDLEKITIVTTIVNNKTYIGLKYESDNKIVISSKSQIGILNKVVSLDDLVSIKDAYSNILFHNENLLYVSNNIDSNENENKLLVKYKTSIYEREKEEMIFKYKVTIPLDSGVLYIRNFLEEYDIVA